MSHYMFQDTGTRNQQGFTLVELAISLMIIGLLLVGVLKGQELIENSRVASVIRQAQNIDAAVATFQETFGALPGDIIDPGTRIPGCTSANCIAAGNGDSIIGTQYAVAATSTFSSSSSGENRSFWLHLAQARLISGVSLGYTGSPVTYGVAFPSSALGGGFWVGNYISSGADTVYANGLRGHYLLLRGGTAGEMIVGGVGTQIATAHQAAMIDRKMDDGFANTGAALAIYPNSGNVCTRWIDVANNQMGYVESTKPLPVCAMALSIQN